jgi:hypothetical protein
MSAKDFKARQRSLLGGGAALGSGAGAGDDVLNSTSLVDKELSAPDSSQAKGLGRVEPVLSEEELVAAVRSVQEQLDQQEGADKQQVDSEVPAHTQKTSWLGWSLLLGLLVSMGVMGAVYKDRIVQEMDNMKEYLEGPKWEKKAQEKPLQEQSSTDSNAKEKGTPEANGSPTQDADKSSKEGDPKQEPLTQEKQPTVGMSSSTKLPIKLDDSLIPEKEAVLSTPESKDKAKSEPKESSSPVAVVSKPLAPEKSDIKIPSLSANPLPTKEEPLRIPILKDPVPLDSPKGVGKEGKKEALKEQAKEPSREQAKDEAKVKTKEKDKDKFSASESSDKAQEPVNASSSVPKSDLDWVNALPEKSWVLQLAAMPNKADLQALKASQPAYEGAKILFTKNPNSGKTYYILIKGPISSKEEAQNLMSAGSALSSAWLRSAKSLKAQFKGN